jgi:hypothetical protein
MAELDVKFWSKIKRAVRKTYRKAKRYAKKTVRKVKRSVKKAGRFVKRVGGKIVNVAKSTWNWVKRKASALARKLVSGIKKIDLMKKVKWAVNKFFTITESRAFEKIFRKVVWKIVRPMGFKKRHVDAAYKLLTRPFWRLQFWFFKWIFTAGPYKSLISPRGKPDFMKATKACGDFVGTVDLGGAIMARMKMWPQVAAAGKMMVKGARIAKPVCRAIKYVWHLRTAYQKIAGWLRKLGIKLPMPRSMKRG